MSDYNNILVRIVETVEREAEYTIEEFATMTGLTTERVMQLNKEALGRHALESDEFWWDLGSHQTYEDSDISEIEAFPA